MTNIAQIGKQYENLIRSKIQSNWSNIPSSAAFGHGPDLVIPFPKKPNTKILVEIKSSTGADFGQKAITFDGTNWIAKHDSTESQSVINLYNHLYTTYKLSDKIKKAWNLPNNKFTSNDLVNIINEKQLPKVLGYEKMIVESTGKRNPFPQVTLESGRQVIQEIISYYNAKNIYYIQIKDKGLYILGKDNLKLNELLGIELPKFNPTSASIILRGKTSTSTSTVRPTLTLKSSDLTSDSKYSLDDDEFISDMYKYIKNIK